MHFLEYISLKQKVYYLHTNWQKEKKIGPILSIMLEEIGFTRNQKKMGNALNDEVRLDNMKKLFKFRFKRQNVFLNKYIQFCTID